MRASLDSPDERRAWPGPLAPWAAAMVTFVVCAWGTAPFAHLLDSAEFAAASFGLGVAHPPGEPLALLAGRAAAFFPLGGVAFRVGIVQALCAAAGAALVVKLALDGLAAARVQDDSVRSWLALGAGLTYGLAPGVVINAVRPEVYTLATLLALLALHLALTAARTRDARPALAAALVIGLGLGNHPLIAGAAGLGAVVAALPLLARGDSAFRLRLMGGSLLMLVLGAAVVFYLPVRSAALFSAPDAGADAVLWGDARSPSGLAWVLSARTFAGKNDIVQTSADPGSAPFVFMEEQGLGVVLLALAGVYLTLRLRRATAVVPVLVSMAGAVAAALVAGFDPANPDIRGYLGIALALFPVVAVVGLALALDFVPRKALSRGLALTALGVQLVWMIPGVRSSLRDDVRAADRATGAMLAALPPRAALLTGHFETGFLVAYQRGVEGRRPDVTWAHLGLARGPGYAERLGRAHPELLPVLTDHARGSLPLDVVRALDVTNPVRVESRGDFAADLVAALHPHGALFALAPEGTEPLTDSQLNDEAARHPETAGFLRFREYQDADLACRARSPRAAAMVAALRVRLPADRLVAALAARCGQAR